MMGLSERNLSFLQDKVYGRTPSTAGEAFDAVWDNSVNIQSTGRGVALGDALEEQQLRSAELGFELETPWYAIFNPPRDTRQWSADPDSLPPLNAPQTRMIADYDAKVRELQQRFPDKGFKTHDEILIAVREEATERRERAEDVLRRAGFGGTLAGFAAYAGLGITDPVNVAVGLAAAPFAPASALGAIAFEFGVGLVSEGLIQTAIIPWQIEQGRDPAEVYREAAVDIGFAGLFGGALTGAAIGVGRGVSGALRRYRKTGDLRDLKAAVEEIPPERLTGEAKAQLQVIERVIGFEDELPPHMRTPDDLKEHLRGYQEAVEIVSSGGLRLRQGDVDITPPDVRAARIAPDDIAPQAIRAGVEIGPLVEAEGRRVIRDPMMGDLDLEDLETAINNYVARELPTTYAGMDEQEILARVNLHMRSNYQNVFGSVPEVAPMLKMTPEQYAATLRADWYKSENAALPAGYRLDFDPKVIDDATGLPRLRITPMERFTIEAPQRGLSEGAQFEIAGAPQTVREARARAAPQAEPLVRPAEITPPKAFDTPEQAQATADRMAERKLQQAQETAPAIKAQLAADVAQRVLKGEYDTAFEQLVKDIYEADPEMLDLELDLFDDGIMRTVREYLAEIEEEEKALAEMTACATGAAG